MAMKAQHECREEWWGCTCGLCLAKTLRMALRDPKRLMLEKSRSTVDSELTLGVYVSEFRFSEV